MLKTLFNFSSEFPMVRVIPNSENVFRNNHLLRSKKIPKICEYHKIYKSFSIGKM